MNSKPLNLTSGISVNVETGNSRHGIEFKDQFLLKEDEDF